MKKVSYTTKQQVFLFHQVRRCFEVNCCLNIASGWKKKLNKIIQEGLNTRPLIALITRDRKQRFRYDLRRKIITSVDRRKYAKLLIEVNKLLHIQLHGNQSQIDQIKTQ